MRALNPRVVSFCALFVFMMLTATAAHAVPVTLTWKPPGGVEPWTNVDGSPATDLAGFVAECNGEEFTLNDPTARTMAAFDFADGTTVNCRMLAFDQSGNQSTWTNAPAFTINVPPAAPSGFTINISVTVGTP